ncbi:MAG: glycosyltransferase family 2 protein [Bdellovibrionota bacterium]
MHPPHRRPPHVGPVSAILVSWNSARTLGKCLESLAGQTRQPAEIFVVDNASGDASRDIAKGFSQITVIENQQNVGFAPAVNQAWKLSKEPWIFLLNPDVVLDKFYLARLLAACEFRDTVGMGQGKLLRMNPEGVPLDPPVLDSTGIEWKSFGAFFMDRGGGKSAKEEIYEEPGEIFGPCAAAALYRREMIEQASWDRQIFDEEFFAYCEDVDLAWRGRRAGWTGFYEPSAIAWHVRGGSNLASPRLEQLLYRNRLWVLAKNASASELLRFSPGWLSFEAAKFLQAMTTKSYLRPALVERIKGWKRMRAKRGLPPKRLPKETAAGATP